MSEYVNGCPSASNCPIGVFDSGLGGLSILRELWRELPGENMVYFGDTLHMPYGPRPLAEVKDYCAAIVHNFAAMPVKAVVVACNTASAAALKHLRTIHPNLPFVGMEPAVKPAVALSRSGKVGVLATTATFQGELFESVVERFAQGTEVLCQPCPGLAEFIENHRPDHPDLIPLIKKFIQPLLVRGVDNLVLACTHYPLIRDAILAAAGPGVIVVDPSPAIARRTKQVLNEAGNLNEAGQGQTTFFVSGDADAFSRSATLLLGKEVNAQKAPFSE